MSDTGRLEAAARFFDDRAASLKARGDAPMAAEMAGEARATAALLREIAALTPRESLVFDAAEDLAAAVAKGDA